MTIQQFQQQITMPGIFPKTRTTKWLLLSIGVLWTLGLSTLEAVPAATNSLLLNSPGNVNNNNNNPLVILSSSSNNNNNLNINNNPNNNNNHNGNNNNMNILSSSSTNGQNSNNNNDNILNGGNIGNVLNVNNQSPINSNPLGNNNGLSNTNVANDINMTGGNGNVPVIMVNSATGTVDLMNATSMGGVGPGVVVLNGVPGGSMGNIVAMPKEKVYDKCTGPADPGPCKQYTFKWRYESTTSECTSFIWGGCEGNPHNRFNSEAECLFHCIGAPRKLRIPR